MGSLPPHGNDHVLWLGSTGHPLDQATGTVDASCSSCSSLQRHNTLNSVTLNSAWHGIVKPVGLEKELIP